MAVQTFLRLVTILLSYIKKADINASMKRWTSTVAAYINTFRMHGLPGILKETEDSRQTLRPSFLLPQKKGLPLIGCLWDYYKNLGRTHQLFTERCNTLGPIFKESVGSTEIVFVADLPSVEKLIRQEARFPRHFDLAPWMEYRKEAEKAHGVLTAQGENWYRMRRAINKPLMRSKQIAEHSDGLNEVTDDFIHRLDSVRDEHCSIVNLEEELFRWALESIGVVLYEKRLGCLDNQLSADTAAFLQAAESIMPLTQKLVYLPPAVSKFCLPTTWREHRQAWDTLFSVAKQCVDEKMAEIQGEYERGEVIEGFLSHLLTSQLSLDEIYANVTELMVGAIHTTTSVLQWLLYELSRAPEVQETLHKEVSDVITSDKTITARHIQTMPYLKASLKEALRLYPVSGGIPRILQEDIVLCDYHIPAGTNVMVLTHVLGRSPDHFTIPDSFRPERWLECEQSIALTRFGYLPFGMGTRMCVGRKLAELEIHILLSKIFQKFRLEPFDSDPIEIKSCLLLQPDRPVRLRFLERD